MTYPDPIALLIAVDGTPEGDYLVPFTGAPQRGGETLLDQWQVDDLLERGYQFAVYLPILDQTIFPAEDLAF
jgi:hypothetical protein